jgi:aspartyl-tRNA(Asn)/glutamyl-tRNA(Gln) amidotransferase subunit A
MHDASGVSAAARCDAALARIAQVNGRIGALSDVLADSARAEARSVDARLAQGHGAGRLSGLPVVIKDNIDTVPARCSAGLPFLADRRPAADAPVVARLRSEGAVVLGVACTDSGAFGVVSPEVANPRHPERIAGGSSGGSAAAVAAGLCAAALGTDTGGSVRIPAACCGIVGFKPTKGRVSTVGVRPLAASLDHVGVLAGSVGGIRSVCEVVDPGFGELPGYVASSPRAPVVGNPIRFYADSDDDVLDTMARMFRLLGELGIVVEEVELPPPDEIVQSHLVLSLTEAVLTQVDVDGPVDPALYPDAARQGMLSGRSYSGCDLRCAMQHRDIFTSRIGGVLDAVDFLMLPTLPVSPPRRGESSVTLKGHELTLLHALIRYTAVFDQTGHPAIAIPFPGAHLPLPGSVQLVGRMDSDRRLLGLAQLIEKRLAEEPQ